MLLLVMERGAKIGKVWQRRNEDFPQVLDVGRVLYGMQIGINLYGDNVPFVGFKRGLFSLGSKKKCQCNGKT
jgi:hypothetical protein